MQNGIIKTAIKIGIIGGTGLEDPDVMDDRTEKIVTTPYGDPSDSLFCGTIDGVDCVVLSRHGRGHSVSPSKINYRANICALKQEGCTHVLVTTCCGSLKEEIVPGHFVVVDQFIDRTTKRDVTFYDQEPGSWPGVCHIPLSQPFCPRLRGLMAEACRLNGATFHSSGTIIVVEGPRFSSLAESNLFRSWGADLINMTTVPEVTLAKEAGLLYAALAMATDYDCWRGSHEEAVNQETVVATFKKNMGTTLKILKTSIKLIAKQGHWEKEIQHVKNLAKDSIMQ